MTTTIVYQRSFFADLNGKPVDSGTLYIGEANQDPETNPIDVYWDADLVTPASQPLSITSGYVTNSGIRAAIYIAEDSYSLRARNRADVQIDYVADANDSTLRSDLAASGGATLVGMAGGGTVESRLGNIGTKDFGVIQGTHSGVALDYSFTGNADGSADFRGWVDKTTAAGSQDIDQVVVRNVQLEMTVGASKTIARAFGQQAYARLGLSGSTTGDVTSVRVYDTHIANEGSGTIAAGTCYYADSVDLNDGTGPIQNAVGFASANMGHATRVTQTAIGFSAGNMTPGAPFTAGFRSLVDDGTNTWAFYSQGSAPSQFTGKVGIGSATRPTDALELFQGYAKLCGSTTKSQDGGCHEARTANNDWTMLFTSTHASAPQGLRIRFAGAAPNNTTQRFLYCDDTATDRLVIWSNGNVVNANNSYGAISDRRLKTGIKDARPQLEDIRKIRFRNYKLKSGGKAAPEHLGVIAQEVADISPGLVSDGDGTLQVNYSLLYLKAVKALQELAAIVEAQGKEIAALKVAQ